MKLFTKKAVDVQVTAQKKVQIDEGTAIAKKIDTLRQTLGSLEVQHKKFVDGMKDGLKKETDYLIQKIASLRIELSDLEAKKSKALEPLDIAWQNVKIKTKEILNLRSELDAREEKLSFREKSTIEREKKSKDSISRLNIRENELDKAYAHALNLKEEAESVKKDADDYVASKSKNIENKERDALIREETNLNDFNSNQAERQMLKDRELGLNARETRLMDREQMLERNIKRLNTKV